MNANITLNEMIIPNQNISNDSNLGSDMSKLKHHIINEARAEFLEFTKSIINPPSFKISTCSRNKDKRDELDIILMNESELQEQLEFSLNKAVVKINDKVYGFINEINICNDDGGNHKKSKKRNNEKIFTVKYYGELQCNAVLKVHVIGSLSELQKQFDAVNYHMSNYFIKPHMQMISDENIENVIIPRDISNIIDKVKLNDSQKEVIRRVIKTSKGVVPVEGPPGTGKTSTIVELIKVYSKLHPDDKILITAPSNKAIFGIALKLHQCNCQFILNCSEKKVDEEEGKNVLTKHLIKDKKINNYNVVLSTLSKSYHQKIRNVNFKFLIVDESGQASQGLYMIPLCHDSIDKVLLVGDIKQLQPVFKSTLTVNDKVYDSILKLFQLRRLSQVIRLNVNYRSSEDTIAFVNEKFYENALTAPEQRNLLADKGINCNKLTFINCDNKESSDSNFKYVNYKQMQVAVDLVDYLLSREIRAGQILIITPYKDQINLIESKLRGEKYNGINVMTCDSCQGREADIVIFMTVRSNNSGKIGFLKDPHRFNVAVTRHKEALFVIGSIKTLIKKQHIFKEFYNFHNKKNNTTVSDRDFFVHPELSQFLVELNLPSEFNGLTPYYDLNPKLFGLLKRYTQNSTYPQILTEVSQQVTIGRRLYRDRELGKARIIFNSVVKNSNNTSYDRYAAFCHLAEICFENVSDKNVRVQGEKYLKSAMTLVDNHAWVYERFAALMYYYKKYDRAIYYSKRALQINGANVFAFDIYQKSYNRYRNQTVE
eukprot:gene21271-27562_t